MLPLLLNKIIQTDKLLFLHLVTQKNRIYTFLSNQSELDRGKIPGDQPG